MNNEPFLDAEPIKGAKNNSAQYKWEIGGIMKEKNLKTSLITGAAAAVLNFILLYSGVRFLLKNALYPRNITVFITLSLIIGMICALFFYFNLKAAAFIFLTGVLIGFIQLYDMFARNLDGWGDLAGLMSYFIWLIIGLVSGLIIQAIIFLIRKWMR